MGFHVVREVPDHLGLVAVPAAGATVVFVLDDVEKVA